MRSKGHSKVKSLHTVQAVSNTKTFFISRITQRSFVKNALTPLPLEQVPQTQVPTPLSGRIVARKVFKGTQLKTQGSVLENEKKNQQSLFEVIASEKFKNIISEGKLRKEEQTLFTLEGPLIFKDRYRHKIFKQSLNIENQFTQQEDNLNIQMFLKNMRQIITTSHIQHNDIQTNENSFLSDNFKAQMTSPRFTFTNHLSTIQLQNQPTQLYKVGSTSMLDPIEEKKEQMQPTMQINRKKLTLSVSNPENQIGVYQFNVPDYCKKSEDKIEEVQEYTDKPKHVLKQALQFISSQPKKMTSKFSKSILKIIGIPDQENPHEDDTLQFYNLQKTSRFMKLYLQNRMSQIFIKLEENILVHLQLIQDKRSSINVLKICESQQSSRLQSCYTNQNNIYTQQLSNPLFQVAIEYNRFQNYQIQYFDYSFADCYLNDLDSFTEDEGGFEIIECQSKLKMINTAYLNFIINTLDPDIRNVMLQDQSSLIDSRMIKDPSYIYHDDQIIRTVNSLYRRIKRKDQIQQVKILIHHYSDILTGIFEDEYEIDNLAHDYGLVEFEEQIQMQQSTNKIEKARIMINSAKPIKKKTSNREQSPPSERSNQKTNSKTIISSPRHQTINYTTNIQKPVKQLLQATSSQTSVLQRRSDSPQDEISLKESSNLNTTQSNKMKATQTLQNTTNPISQKEEEIIQPLMTKSQERRNPIIISSMSKHALQMRTQITEARRRQSIAIIEKIKLLIEEQKLPELEEEFTNNPNLMINERFKGNNTYLIVAAQTGNIEIVEFLLRKGAQVNLQNNDGDTALHKAISYQFYNVADLLIAQGAQNLRNYDGLSPWQLVQ
ncbi:unnamed protein product [Paramecium octaurelia]|uniref:Uncharacterized protein n=1 Tax=Paramecium octaurelia TaxID=43137 RepID=A0A8S1TX73_PAROT|nr:unnamed protein product [Paramecium octaurelia]